MNENVNKKVLLSSGITAIVFAACAVICVLLELIVAGTSGNIEFIDAGERWSANGDRYAVVTMYAEEESGVSWDQITQWAFSMDSALLNASITPNEGARSWTYSAAAETTMQVTGPMGKTTAEIMAVSGDFFVVHPMKFVYGSAFLNDNSNPMGVVIDRDLAWDIFGAENIIGMNLEISGQQYTVVGVAEKESGRGMYAHTYGDRPRMYMNYAGYAKISGESYDITIFEAVLPNAVSAFAKGIFDGVVRVNEETTEVVEVSDRFSLKNRFENIKLLPYSWIRGNKIEYPYWENEAKTYDFAYAVIMIFEVILAAAGIVSALLSFILLRVSGYTVTDTVKNTIRKIQSKKSASGGKKYSSGRAVRKRKRLPDTEM